MKRRAVCHPETLHTLVLIHGVYEPSLEQIEMLTENESVAVEDYCARAHLRASDNNVRVPVEPSVMKGWAKQS